MLKIREKAKIHARRKRFALLPATGQGYRILIDRDAEEVYAGEREGRYVARVAEPYADAVLDLMNFTDCEHHALLALKPAKRGNPQRQHEPNEGGSENP